MKRLDTRIYLHFLGVLLVVGAASSMVFATGWNASVWRTFSHRWVRHMANLIGAAEPSERDQVVRHLSEELAYDLTLRSPDGAALLSAGPPLPEIVGQELAKTRTEAAFIGHPRDRLVAAPVHDSTGALVGILEAKAMRRFNPELYGPVAGVALALLVVAIAVAPLARRISRPVERLTEASRRLGEGDLAYRVPLHERWKRGHVNKGRRHPTPRLDELEQLTRAWNDMAQRVEGLVSGQRELLANVSHELRSPLQRIRVAMELLPEAARTEARMGDVNQDLAELERLIDDVLTTSRLQATGLPTHVEEVDLRALAKQICDRARHDPVTADKEVRTEGGHGLLVSADGALLKRALWNLVENAAKYGAPPIVLEIAEEDEHVRLSVVDRGAGIDPADRERVFDPFYRADKAHTPMRNQGYGLGLTLARRVAEVHGGTIFVEAADPIENTGCRIALEIPRHPPQT